MTESAPQASAAQASAPASTAQPAAIQALQQAADGLLFPSETDAPLLPFFWPGESKTATNDAITPERVKELAKAPEDAPIKTVKLDSFFRPATREEEWHNDEEKAEVQRFQELVKAIKANLKEVKVFRIGETRVDAYIVGLVEGGYGGLKTQVVET